MKDSDYDKALTEDCRFCCGIHSNLLNSTITKVDLSSVSYSEQT